MDEAGDVLRGLGAEIVPSGPVEVLPADKDVPLIYTNGIQLKVSVYDVTLTLGVGTSVDPDRTVIKPVAQVVMSPQHAKVLASALETNVKAYEAAFGPIPEARPPSARANEPQPRSGQSPDVTPE